METDEWVCCNCGIIVLDRNWRCPTCHSDNVVPAHVPEPSVPSGPCGIERHWAEEAERKVHVMPEKRVPSYPEPTRKAG